MKKFNQVPFFLITGACASGKSFYVKLLKENFINNNIIKIHDFDEKIQLNIKDAVEFFIELCLENWKNNCFTIVCGGITPEDLKKSEKNFSDLKIYSCLLNVEDNEREKRLMQRNDVFFKDINNLNNLNLSKDEIIKSIISGSNDYKNLIKLSDEFIEIDNTTPNNSDTLDRICFWINSKIEEIKEGLNGSYTNF